MSKEEAIQSIQAELKKIAEQTDHFAERVRETLHSPNEAVLRLGASAARYQAQGLAQHYSNIDNLLAQLEVK